MEATIKIIASGFKNYFSDGWNRFDFVIAIGSVVSIVVSIYGKFALKGAITLFRSFRVLRIIRLIKRGGKSLKMIFNTFVITV